MNNKYVNLEENMVKYQDLVKVKIRECGEKMIFVSIKTINNRKIILREAVVKKLIKAEELLKKQKPDLRLLVYYGYRSIKIQTLRFLEILNKTCKNYYPNPIDLYEAVHRSVAVPTVAGHPTGGAVDTTIIDKYNREIDFGSKIYDYSTKNSYVFSQNISKKSKKNRILLREIMLCVGFAPFDGEWWHFSYGDREWTYYYKRKFAIYQQIEKLKSTPKT